jgi:hypothetical protein
LGQAFLTAWAFRALGHPVRPAREQVLGRVPDGDAQVAAFVDPLLQQILLAEVFLGGVNDDLVDCDRRAVGKVGSASNVVSQSASSRRFASLPSQHGPLPLCKLSYQL